MKIGLLLGLLLIPVRVQAQLPPCIEPPTPPSTAPLDVAKLVPFAVTIADTSTIVSHELAYFDVDPNPVNDPNAVPRYVFPILYASLQPTVGTTDCFTFTAPPPEMAGLYYAGLRHRYTTLDNPQGITPWTFIAAPAGFAVQPPACADIPFVFITRWEMTTGRPGSKMRLNYQLASVSPITSIDVKLDGVVVRGMRGEDLTADGGIWLTTPPFGSYKIQVAVKNTAGCVKEVFAPVDLVVR